MYNLFRGLSGSHGLASSGKVLTPKGCSEAAVQINIWNRPSGKSLMFCGRHMAWLLGWPINEAFHSCPDSRNGKPRGQTSVWLPRLLCERARLLCERALSSVFQAPVSFTAQKRACVCSCSQQWGAWGSALASGCFPAPSQVPTRLAATSRMHASSPIWMLVLCWHVSQGKRTAHSLIGWLLSGDVYIFIGGRGELDHQILEEIVQIHSTY